MHFRWRRHLGDVTVLVRKHWARVEGEKGQLVLLEFKIDLCKSLPSGEFRRGGVDGTFRALEREVIATLGHAELGLHVEEGRVKRENFYRVVEKGDGFNFFVGIDEDTGEEGGNLGVFGTEFFKKVDPRGEAAGSVDVGEETGGEVVGYEGGDLNFGVRAELVAWGVLAVGPDAVDGIKEADLERRVFQRRPGICARIQCL